MKNLILCGFMGSGKSTLAELLSKEYRMLLVDTDREIEKNEGMSIKEIFSVKGEQYFRNLETKLISELSQKSGMVISLGGGLAANPSNHKYLKEAGKVILLDCGIEETLRRIVSDSSRPLTAGGEDDIIARYNFRKPIYESVADIIIDSSSSPDRTFTLAVTAIEELL